MILSVFLTRTCTKLFEFVFDLDQRCPNHSPRVANGRFNVAPGILNKIESFNSHFSIETLEDAEKKLIQDVPFWSFHDELREKDYKV